MSPPLDGGFTPNPPAPPQPGSLAERLWWLYGAERDRLLHEAIAGRLHVERVCRVADLWRAYLIAAESP